MAEIYAWRGRVEVIGFDLLLNSPRGVVLGDFVVVKISGRLLSPPRSDYFKGLRDSILEASKSVGVAIVTGGGPLARSYIDVLRGLGVSEAFLDIVGIKVSRLNALALALTLMPHSHPRAFESIEEAAEAAFKGLIPVMGGLQPGQSTNAVALALAEALRAKLVINMLSGIDGVYKPPPGFEGSRRLDKLSYTDMEELLRAYPQIAGSYELLDMVALRIAERSRIKVFFTSGDDPKVIAKIVGGERVNGTLLS